MRSLLLAGLLAAGSMAAEPSMYVRQVQTALAKTSMDAFLTEPLVRGIVRDAVRENPYFATNPARAVAGVARHKMYQAVLGPSGLSAGTDEEFRTSGRDLTRHLGTLVKALDTPEAVTAVYEQHKPAIVDEIRSIGQEAEVIIAVDFVLSGQDQYANAFLGRRSFQDPSLDDPYVEMLRDLKATLETPTP